VGRGLDPNGWEGHRLCPQVQVAGEVVFEAGLLPTLEACFRPLIRSIRLPTQGVPEISVEKPDAPIFQGLGRATVMLHLMARSVSQNRAPVALLAENFLAVRTRK
jgi:hypothetical protein